MNTLNQQENIILEAALELPPKELAAYLDRACEGDAQLRQRIVEAIFQAEERAAGELAALEQMLGQTRSSEPHLRRAAGEVINLLEELQGR